MIDTCGKRVSVFFDDGEGDWFDGTVSEYKSKLEPDGTVAARIKISYDDGTISKWLDAVAEEEAGQLKFISAAPAAAASAPVPAAASASKRGRSDAPAEAAKKGKVAADRPRAGESQRGEGAGDAGEGGPASIASGSSRGSVGPAPATSNGGAPAVPAAPAASSGAAAPAAPAAPAALGPVPAKPRDLGTRTNAQSELLSGSAGGQKGITRECLGRHAGALGLRSAAIQGAICTKGGVVSHLVLNEEFNDLSPSIADVLEFWVSNGTQRNKSAQLMNPNTSPQQLPNTSPQQLVPVFWVSDKQNRKGGDLAIYVGHFSPARVTAFATLVQHKKAPRRTLVELHFTRFDAEFAQFTTQPYPWNGRIQP